MKLAKNFMALSLLVLAGIMLSACAESITASEDTIRGLTKTEADSTLTGRVEGIAADEWTVSGKIVKVNGDTLVNGEIKVGDEVNVEGFVADDGTLQALHIETAQTSMSSSGGEIEFYGIVQEISLTAWVVDGQKVRITAQTEIKGSILVDDLVKVHAFISDDGSLTAREIELPSDDERENEVHQDEVEFTGLVDAMGESSWTIAGRIVSITEWTEIKDEIKLGDLVKVEAFEDEDGLIAKEIEFAEDDMDDSDDIDDHEDDDVDDTDDDEHEEDEGDDHSGQHEEDEDDDHSDEHEEDEDDEDDD
ncbi:MAG: hypothetical protein GTO18_14460 [Anaerolineales bacterium]|nr:hypothetical protein [Anaerolineales bacterium]